MQHRFTLNEQEYALWLAREDDHYRMHLADAAVPVALERQNGDRHLLRVGDRQAEVLVAVDGDAVHVHLDGASWSLRYLNPVDYFARHAGASADDVILAPMPGVVIGLNVAAGDAVKRDETLMIIESMKLETAIKASRDGVVETVHVNKGQSFDRSAALATLVAETER